MTQTVWLTRHGNREDFVDPEWKHSAARPHDPDLSPDGIMQARRLAERLRGEHIAYIFASPFLRTVHTASIVADVLDLAVFLEARIAEWMNPEWFAAVPERLSISDLARRFPRIDPSYSSLARATYPESESEALQRAGKTARAIGGSYVNPLLLVGHGVSVAGAVHGLVSDVEITECALCSLFRVVRRNGRWRLDLRGDVSHLEHRAASDRFQ